MRSNVTLTSLFPLLGMIPLQVLVVEEEDLNCGGSVGCCCKKEKKRSSCCCESDGWNACKKQETPWGEDEGVCLGRRDYYQTNDGDDNFNRWNDWGEPSPVHRRSWEELAEQEHNPQPDGIDIHVDRPTRDMFFSQKAYASAKSKYAQLEDLAHSINWKNKEPMKGIAQNRRERLDWFD